MTRGALLFAQNNSEIDYVEMAIYAASKIKQHLGVPVSLVTDSNRAGLDLHFDHIIETTATSPYVKSFRDGADKTVKLEWKNTSRADSFDLSPYNETLVIDTDYIINSSNLSYCWNQPNDFLIYQKSYDLAHWRDKQEFDLVSDHSIPFYWATTFWFRKTEMTKIFFDLIKEIRTNWVYYKLAYQIHSTNFRNDHAFSIAIHMLNGFGPGFFAQQLPGKMFYTLDSDLLLSHSNDSMHFLVEKQDSSAEYISLKTKGLDVHVMNKYSLMRLIANE